MKTSQKEVFDAASLGSIEADAEAPPQKFETDQTGKGPVSESKVRREHDERTS
jgi:hypothetical protein